MPPRPASPGLFDNEDERALALKLFKDIEKEIVRGAILRDGTRIDGRDTKTVRPIECQVGILPRAHGSVLFTRGETQALVVATLGTGQDEQIIDALEGEYRENFMLHYNFPPYSTGEAGRMGSPGRREIGHGKLAWRAVRPLLPSKESFPYTIRVVSEITEFERLVVDGLGVRRLARADGCRGAAGAPGRRHRDGADQGARGLCRPVRHPRRRGPSRRHGLQGGRDRARGHRAADGHQDHLDHRGDHARRARPGDATAASHILGEMAKALTGARDEVSENAPRITTISIPKDKIREVIGSGGKVIREITETTGAKIDIRR